MRFGTLVVKNLVRRPLRSALTAAAIAVAIGAVVALVGVAGGFEKTFLRLYESTNVDLIVVQTRGKQQQLAGTLDESLGDKIAQIPGVKTILTSLSDMVAIEEAGSMGVVMQGWPPESANFNHIHIATGRTLTKADTKHVLLGSILAKNLEKGVGDSVELLEKERFTVVGIFETDNTFQNGSLVVPLAELQRLMSKPGQVTGFSVCLTDSNDKVLLQEVRQKIESLGKRITASPTREHVETITEIKVAKGMAWLTSTIALVIGLFGLTNTAVMSVSRAHERTRNPPRRRLATGPGRPDDRGRVGAVEYCRGRDGHGRRHRRRETADPRTRRQRVDRGTDRMAPRGPGLRDRDRDRFAGESDSRPAGRADGAGRSPSARVDLILRQHPTV